MWLVAAAAGIVYQWSGVRRDTQRFPAPGRIVRVGPHLLHLYELGQGSPAVVLESGISATSINWRGVQTEIAKFTRALAYDRAGLGWSGPARTPRTAAQIVEELREMLRAAQVPAPYILVGHSFGGLVVRLYAARYPEEVAGLVLVDPLRPREWHPLTAQQRRNLIGGAVLSRWGAFLAHCGVVRFTLVRLSGGSRLFPRLIGRAASSRAGLETMERIAGEIRKMPPELWPAIASHWCHPKSFSSMAAHLRSLPASVVSIVAAAPPANIPVIILTGAKSATKWSDEEIAGLSNDVTHIVAADSGHWIQLDEPSLVVDAVRNLMPTGSGPGRDHKGTATKSSGAKAAPIIPPAEPPRD